MRIRAVIIALAAGIIYAAQGIHGARADHHPVVAVPGHPYAPVIIHGHDASWSVVEGDWGLYRAGHMAPTVYYPYPRYDHWKTRAYYPFTGKRPRYGRREIIPPANRPLPPRAESYYRYWSNDGPPVPAQADYPQPLPPMILAPRVRSLN